MKLWEAAQAVEGAEISGADPETEITGICCDSRKAAPGMLFVAIQGYQTDGNVYAAKALAAGAAAVVSERRLEGEVPQITVKNSRRALAQLADKWYGHPSGAFKLVGITGTNGKTTTSYLLKKILEQASGEKVGLIGTNQIMIGEDARDAQRTTPESVELQALFAEMRDRGCGYVVMEVSSHALSLERVTGCDFDVGVFTNLTQDHLDFHGDLIHYRDAKAKLFSQCRVGVFNLDDEAGQWIMKQAGCPKKIGYGVDCDTGDVAVKNLRMSAAGVSYEALINGDIHRVSLGIPGKFSVYNSLAAVSAALALGFSLESAASGLREAPGVRGRAEVVWAKDFTVIVDYAHTPDGMENILKTAREFTKGRLIALFGCGGDRDAAKRPIMGEIGVRLSDIAVITSDNPRSEDPEDIIRQIVAGVPDGKNAPAVIPDRREAIGWALDRARREDTVLILGKGHETYQEIGGVRHHFDDREEVLLHLNGK